MENQQNMKTNQHETNLDPNNGSQIVVEHNTGTININNYPQKDFIEMYREDNKNQWRGLGQAFDEIRKSLKQLKKQKRKSK